MPGSISEETVSETPKIEEASSPPLKHKETRGSISSVDSSISLSYDAIPFTPRGSLTDGSVGLTTDEELGKNSSEGTEDSSDCTSGTESKRVLQVAVAGTGTEKGIGIGKVEPAVATNTNNDTGKEEDDYECPDEELTKKIVDQVEYYFSDENIVKDAFLLKHVRRNKEGYVSLKLIASFKRVKHIAKDWRAVRDSLRKSDKLEINEAGTKLRRMDPLPLYDQTTPSRTIVVINIPPEKATIERIAEMFRTCGEIALVRVLRPGNPIPADVRPFYNKHPEMQGVVSGLIEFVRTESAHNALNKEPPANSDMQVLELNAPPSKKRSVNGGRSKFFHHSRHLIDSDFSSSCQSSSETDDLRFKHRMQRRCSSPHLANSGQAVKFGASDPPVLHWNPPRRWSRDSGSESPGSNYSRSRSNSGVCFGVFDQPRRMSAGWESSSDSYTSCRSRSNSGVSIPDVFAMRKYSLTRKEQSSDCCCCSSSPKCESPVLNNNNSNSSCNNGGRRYSFGKGSNDSGSFAATNPVGRCGNDCTAQELYRNQPSTEYYCPPQHRNIAQSSSGGLYERRSSFGKSLDTGGIGNWSRVSGNNGGESIRRLSDSEGRMSGGLMRQRSFGNGPVNMGPGAENVVRMPRGPDGGRGFQRDLMEYALPE